MKTASCIENMATSYVWLPNVLSIADPAEINQIYGIGREFYKTRADGVMDRPGDRVTAEQIALILETVADYMAISSLHPFRPKSYGSDLANLQQFGQTPWIHKFLLGRRFIARLMLGTSGGNKEMMQLALSQIESAKQNSSEGGPLTFVQRLLLNQAKDPSSMKDRDIMTHALCNISAGSNTSAIALRSILYHILKDRRVYNKLYDEFRVLEDPVQFTDANKLPYFAAVIQEALRIHPSVGMMLAPVVPAGVGINPWVLHRDPEVFPDPDSFRPERWLQGETGDNQRKLMNSFFLTFGHGAHTCSGRWIKVIPSLMLRFMMTLANDDKYGSNNRWFTTQHGLSVKFIERAP
ncbi:Cytochrome P450 [Penicillium cf. griseofulvum]|uniref:Cytochrome P450 n=1 Tax=Penicillium cf. griseofulvum TaxID=2972120 RepID=A0A9W9MYW2_9EURO|nr:Cytochrome P450 [Penicillium cf. griseofulvum]KAJ5421469.1 Cytochrome P450 [Penicillium cf. griseofulvum]KAJ5424700.1 Cytochrome P450 [Penicillium cf. griseofulvum]